MYINKSISMQDTRKTRPYASAIGTVFDCSRSNGRASCRIRRSSACGTRVGAGVGAGLVGPSNSTPDMDYHMRKRRLAPPKEEVKPAQLLASARPIQLQPVQTSSLVSPPMLFRNATANSKLPVNILAPSLATSTVPLEEDCVMTR